jgi:cytidyltransferase-like protein
MNNIAYCGMCADIVHRGHINIIKEANKLDCKVMIGLLTDEAIKSYKHGPYMNYYEREYILNSIVGVDIVVPQNSLDYTFNIMKYKPKYVLHGDDWLIGVQKSIRDNIEQILATYGGHIIDIPYTADISSSLIKLQKDRIDWIDTQPP